MNGLDVMRRLKEHGLPARFILLTGHADEQLATEALSEGAAGFLVKPVVTDDMREAIQTVAKRRRPCSELHPAAPRDRTADARPGSRVICRRAMDSPESMTRWQPDVRALHTSLSHQRRARGENALALPDKAATGGRVVTAEYHRRENRIEGASLRRDVHRRQQAAADLHTLTEILPRVERLLTRCFARLLVSTIVMRGWRRVINRHAARRGPVAWGRPRMLARRGLPWRPRSCRRPG